MSIYIFLGVIVVAIVGVVVHFNVEIGSMNNRVRASEAEFALNFNSIVTQIKSATAENVRDSNDVDPNKMTIVVADYLSGFDSDILGTLFKINDINWRIVKVSKIRETLPNNYPYTAEHNILECERVEK